MKRLLLSIVAATALFTPCVASAVDIYGVWVRDGHATDKLEFFDCQGKLCAKGILPMRDGSPAPLILRHAAKTGPSSWKGDLFNPEDGKTYSGKIAYEAPNQLTLTGCLVAFLCQSESWTRISGPTKPAAPADQKGDAKPASEKAGEKGATTKATPGQDPKDAKDPKAAKPAKSADPKAAAPAKPAPSKPAPKPAADAE